ncbi:cysteine proteinase inhibitor 5-like [Cucumis melo var. makuwa]|uniref:Cysteine proteinase inhibitor 5-like n=2 Tax=Cucumis melo TaxID=3656 RepID=A0A5D3BUP8_CUCMM|nr:cysteine proteinase inhibitor 5-like [Cucumis melo var. makuwa]TYK02708.1 cysteine proteinase inhibitor 5-like [Cucumis melo var. makuwa]
MCTPKVVGGYFPCPNPDDPHVKEIAEWVVKTYHLTLLGILECEQQVVAGINWRLLLKCRDENKGENHYYQTVVYEKPWEHLRRITDFYRLCPCE